jgi:glycosyltransferase involved in cell wall biosynthesis
LNIRKINKQAKISVIVPIYNKELYIEKCLNSILQQTLSEIEIILIDDGSTDNSVNVINTFKDSRINLIRQKNKGASSARNCGIKIATGEYIAFVDADDYIENTMYEKMYTTAENLNSDIIVCQFRKYNSTGTLFETNSLDETFESILLGKSFSVMWNKIYKRSLFTENNISFMENIYYEDIGTLYKLYHFAKKINVIEDRFYNWYLRENSVTESFTKKHINSMFKVLIDMLDFIKTHNLISKYFEYYLIKYFSSIEFLFNRVHTHCKEFSLSKSLYKLIFINFEKDSIFDDENFEKLKFLNFNLYHEIRFFILNKDLLTNLSKNQLSFILKNLSIKKEETISSDQNLIQNLLMKKRVLYNSQIENFIKLDFSIKLNSLFKEIKKLTTQNKKFAIYGNGIIGNIIAKEIKENLIVIFDQNNHIQSEYSNVVLPSEMKNYNFDTLIISVFGRENLIKNNLKKVDFEILEISINESENLLTYQYIYSDF